MLYGFLIALIVNLNQGVMKFPVQNGTIVSKDVSEMNGSLSTTIKISADNNIYSCSSGKVTSILILSDSTFFVVVENDDKAVYMYSDLDHVNVFQNQKIEMGQVLGTKEKKQGENCLYFSVFRNKKELNARKFIVYK